MNTCTAVCQDKENLKTLLNNISDRWTGYRDSSNKLYKFWLRMNMENDLDISNITGRASRLQSGVQWTP